MNHYANGFNVYTDTVCMSSTKPCGVGEFIVVTRITRRRVSSGSGTSVMAMRLKNASDSAA